MSTRLKITGLKTFLVNTSAPGDAYPKNWIFVKVYTDEGIDGLGEAFGTGKAKTTEAALLEFEHWLVGKDPTRIIHNFEAIYRGSRYPLGTATMSALSAVEQALWDIAGKNCGLPVYKMLGGPCRDRIRVYACGTHYFPTMSLESLIEEAKKVVKSGFTAIKFMPQPPDWASKSPEALFRESVKRVESVRKELGDDVDLCLDYHGRSPSPMEGIRLAKALEPYHPYFIEEPALTNYPDSIALVKSKTIIPIAGGEKSITRDYMREVIDRDAVNIIQPEPVACGGILPTIKMAATAEVKDIMVAPHQASSPVSLVTCAHIDACIPNFLIQACNIGLNTEYARDIIIGMPKIENGYMELPDKPGLGIELNEEGVKDHPYKPFDRVVIINQDGSVGLE